MFVFVARILDRGGTLRAAGRSAVEWRNQGRREAFKSPDPPAGSPWRIARLVFCISLDMIGDHRRGRVAILVRDGEAAAFPGARFRRPWQFCLDGSSPVLCLTYHHMPIYTADGRYTLSHAVVALAEKLDHDPVCGCFFGPDDWRSASGANAWPRTEVP